MYIYIERARQRERERDVHYALQQLFYGYLAYDGCPMDLFLFIGVPWISPV